MKFPTALFLAAMPIGLSSAFVLPDGKKVNNLSHSMSNDQWGNRRGGVQLELSKKSASIPFVDRPKFLDGSLAGDVGFDPMGFADNKSNLMMYREAEIRHARLAMLAAAGWPMSELLNKPIADTFGLTSVLDETHRVPSVLNGGLGRVSIAYWIGCVLLAGAVDLYSITNGPNKNGLKTDSVPGNLGFDPFGLYPKTEKDQKWMQTAEIKNGRLAMIAITGFAFQEFASHLAVVDQTPFFFQPIWETLANLTPHFEVPDQFEMPEVTQVFESTTTPAVSVPMEAVTTPLVDAPPAVVPPSGAAIVNPAQGALDIVSSSPPVVADAANPLGAASASPENYAEELVDAKARIAQLESKLASISDLTR